MSHAVRACTLSQKRLDESQGKFVSRVMLLSRCLVTQGSLSSILKLNELVDVHLGVVTMSSFSLNTGLGVDWAKALNGVLVVGERKVLAPGDWNRFGLGDDGENTLDLERPFTDGEIIKGSSSFNVSERLLTSCLDSF